MNPMTHAEALKALFVEGADLDLTDRHAAQYALCIAGQIERTAQTLIDSLVDGNDAMRAVADEPMFSEEPFADQIRQTIAARRIPVATPAEDAALDEIEARQVDLSKPEVFDILGFTQSYFNQKGA